MKLKVSGASRVDAFMSISRYFCQSIEIFRSHSRLTTEMTLCLCRFEWHKIRQMGFRGKSVWNISRFESGTECSDVSI
eukprot:15324691-Ditylum_brightwellii.AAC.1